MSGNEDQLVNGILNPETDGLVPRSAVYIFDRIARRSNDANVSISLRASYTEIYNEQVFCLISSLERSVLIATAAYPVFIFRSAIF